MIFLVIGTKLSTSTKLIAIIGSDPVLATRVRVGDGTEPLIVSRILDPRPLDV
jgi:hypothetical protein